MKNPAASIWNWADERLHLSAIFRATLTEYMVPRNLTLWHTLGSILIACFVIQVVTGMLLLVYYVPEVSKAFESVTFISNGVSFGWLVRRIHAMTSHLFVLAVFLHLLSTLFMRTYRKPREPQWLTGMILFGLVLTAALSGYLLPWSQLSYWATTVSTNSAGSIPGIGKELVLWLRGTDKVTQFTLGRFFALHTSIVPFTIFAMVGIHLLFLRQTGIAAPKAKSEAARAKVPFYPHMLTKELFSIFILLALLNVLVFYFPQLNFPADTLRPANPLETPAHIKPEWYFLANYQVLKSVPNEFLGIFLQMCVGVVLLLLPFLDRSREDDMRFHRLFLGVATLGVIGYVGMLIWGYLS
ncbi:MAG TPA: cytochrome bc complex cytochrome b subunit [Armatimonadota bacterium]|jgi:ubiquinol-cytochrome c reductase cytochrome b subunit